MASPRTTSNSGHVYEFNGIRYPSVTTVLSRTMPQEKADALENWRKTFRMTGFKSARDYTHYTSYRGTIVHYNILGSVLRSTTGFSLDPGDLPTSDLWWKRKDALMTEVASSRRQWDQEQFDIHPPITVETPNYHPDHFYAGTPDLVAVIDGVPTIVDLKTSKQHDPSYELQIGAYAEMLNFWKPETVKRGMLVYLHPKNNKARIVELSTADLQLAFATFVEDRLEPFWDIPGVRAEYNLGAQS